LGDLKTTGRIHHERPGSDLRPQWRKIEADIQAMSTRMGKGKCRRERGAEGWLWRVDFGDLAERDVGGETGAATRRRSGRQRGGARRATRATLSRAVKCLEEVPEAPIKRETHTMTGMAVIVFRE